MRSIASLLSLVAFFSVAVADVPPPPPPKGQKYVDINHEVLANKDVTGYVFIEGVSGFGAEAKYRKLELNATKAIAISKGGRRIGVALYAVPEKIAKEYKTDADLGKALFNNKIDGIQPLFFDGSTFISDSDKRNAVTWTHTITSVGKDGALKVETKGDGFGKKFPTSAENDTVAKPHLLIAGLAITLALCFGGLWFMRRR